MTSFSQLGDPICPACLCEHHGATYAETPDWEHSIYTKDILYYPFANGATIISHTITITARCCVVVNVALLGDTAVLPIGFEIERPLASIRTTQRDHLDLVGVYMNHHAAWEVLPPGAHTYFVVNRSGATRNVAGAWIKIIASGCEG